MWTESIDVNNNKNYTQILGSVGYQIKPVVRNQRMIWQVYKNGEEFNWSDVLEVAQAYIDDFYKKSVEVGTIVERKWGHYTVIAMGERYLVKKLVFKPNQAISYQFHTYRRETWTIIKGNGIFRTERSNTFYDYLGSCFTHPYKSYLSPPPIPLVEVNETKKTGDVISIGILQKHKFTAGADGAEVIEVWSGSKLDENDITRIDEV